MKPDSAILVLGCKKHEETAQRMFALLSLYWKRAYTSAWLCTDETDPYLESIAPKRIVSEPNGSFADRIRKGLDAAPEADYVLLLLDDYFVTGQVDETAFDAIVDAMRNNDVNYCKLIGLPRCFKKDKRIHGAYRIKQSTHYGISLQPSIWRKQSLIEALSLTKGGSPWQVEAAFSSYQAHHYGSCVTFNRNFLHIKNGLLRGKRFPYTNKILTRNNLEPLDLPGISRLHYWRVSFKQHVAMHIPAFLRKIGKLVGNKFGKQYYSDN